RDRRLEGHAPGDRPAPLDRHTQVGLPDAHVDHVLNRLDVDAVPRGGLAVDLDVDIRGAGQGFGRDVGRARDLAQRSGHFVRETFELVQIAAENLDADLRADASG